MNSNIRISKDEYYLIFHMKNESEFCSSDVFEEEIDERIIKHEIVGLLYC